MSQIDVEFEEQFDELAQRGFDGSGAIDGVMPANGDFPRAVRFVKAEDGVMFAAKLLVNREDTANDILLYRKQPRGVAEGDWLADVELYADHFQADYFSLLADQIGAVDSGSVRQALQKHKKFFAAQTRIKHFVAVMPSPASGGTRLYAVFAAFGIRRGAAAVGQIQYERSLVGLSFPSHGFPRCS